MCQSCADKAVTFKSGSLKADLDRDFAFHLCTTSVAVCCTA